MAQDSHDTVINPIFRQKIHISIPDYFLINDSKPLTGLQSIFYPVLEQNSLSFPFPLRLPVHFDMTIPLYPIYSLIPDFPIADYLTASAI
jgi:hypothetical protein